MALYDFLELDERIESRNGWKSSVEKTSRPHPSLVASLVEANTRVAIVSERITQRESEHPGYSNAFHEARTRFIAWRDNLVIHQRLEDPKELFDGIKKMGLKRQL